MRALSVPKSINEMKMKMNRQEMKIMAKEMLFGITTNPLY